MMDLSLQGIVKCFVCQTKCFCNYCQVLNLELNAEKHEYEL